MMQPEGALQAQGHLCGEQAGAVRRNYARTHGIENAIRLGGFCWVGSASRGVLRCRGCHAQAPALVASVIPVVSRCVARTMCAPCSTSCGLCCQGIVASSLKGLAALQAICGLVVGLYAATYLPLDAAFDLSVVWLATLLIAGGSVLFLLGGLAATSSWCRIGAAPTHSVSAAARVCWRSWRLRPSKLKC